MIFVPFMTAIGGVERLALNLSRHLYKRGAPHMIVTFSNSMNLGTYADWPVNIVELRGRRNSLLEMRRLRRWLKAQAKSNASNDSILVFDLKGAFYVPFCPSPYVLHLTDPPSLLTADVSKHAPSIATSPKTSSARQLRGELVHRVNSAGVKRARTVIAMTNHIAREIQELYGVNPVILRPGIQTPPQLPRVGPRAGPLRFLTIVRLVPTKRIDWILDLLANLEVTRWKGLVEWELIVVGDGPTRDELVTQAAGLGISDSIRWLGTVTDDELEKAYAEASVFLMPAAQGWGLPALEALVRHLPVVLHEASGVAEILGGSPWVELARGESSADFGAATKKMIERLDLLHEEGTPPVVPRDDDWAAKIFAECGWNTNQPEGARHA